MKRLARDREGKQLVFCDQCGARVYEPPCRIEEALARACKSCGAPAADGRRKAGYPAGRLRRSLKQIAEELNEAYKID